MLVKGLTKIFYYSSQGKRGTAEGRVFQNTSWLQNVCEWQAARAWFRLQPSSLDLNSCLYYCVVLWGERPTSSSHKKALGHQKTAPIWVTASSVLEGFWFSNATWQRIFKGLAQEKIQFLQKYVNKLNCNNQKQLKTSIFLNFLITIIVSIYRHS